MILRWSWYPWWTVSTRWMRGSCDAIDNVNRTCISQRVVRRANSCDNASTRALLARDPTNTRVGKNKRVWHRDERIRPIRARCLRRSTTASEDTVAAGGNTTR